MPYIELPESLLPFTIFQVVLIWTYMLQARPNTCPNQNTFPLPTISAATRRAKASLRKISHTSKETTSYAEKSAAEGSRNGFTMNTISNAYMIS